MIEIFLEFDIKNGEVSIKYSKTYHELTQVEKLDVLRELSVELMEEYKGILKGERDNECRFIQDKQ